MPVEELNLMIGGEAGQGLATVSRGLAKALVRGGYEIVVTQSYHSRIRGGHNTMSIRASVEPITAPKDKVDILMALNSETVELHLGGLAPGGLIVADEALECGSAPVLKAPFAQLSPKRFHNVVGLGILGALLSLDQELIWGVLQYLFKKMPEDVAQKNRSALAAAYEWTKEHQLACEPLAPSKGHKGRLMMGGNDAIALGAISAGVKFCSFYPMTPATSIALGMVANAERMGLIVEQAEDEIAAVNMAVGASYAGAPALVPTSGGGFALMTEGVSLAGMMETPLVLAVAMRPGPATGLPTRTEQGDLELVLYGGHGEFPRAIFTPGSVEECFHLTRRAVLQADKFQTPVFVLTDQFLADSFRSVEPFDLRDLEAVPIPAVAPPDYQRFKITEVGVSPRAIPGVSQALVVADSDEHTEDGHITEDLDVRVRMVDKRLKKMYGLAGSVTKPVFYGHKSPDLLLVGWGSSKGCLQEVVETLCGQGQMVGGCHFRQVWPLDEDLFMERFQKARMVIGVEGNATGQFSKLIRRQTGFSMDRVITRYDGLPFTPGYILERIAGWQEA
jgi:2-oxoglutarate ferredoxin oxidoreductase subunit alpha